MLLAVNCKGQSSYKMVEFLSQMLKTDTSHTAGKGEVWGVFCEVNIVHNFIYVLVVLYMGQVMELWLSCYLVLLSVDSKTW